MGRLIGIDYGFARIGMAISDERHIIASPLVTITTEKNFKKTAEKVYTEIKKHDVDALVIGVPFHMNGKLGCH